MKQIYHVEPAYHKNVPWATDAVIKMYHLDLDVDKVGQMYHVIALPGHYDCTITETGEKLSDFYADHPELFNCPWEQFPIRMATSSSGGKMSYQVHPDDEYALKHEGQRGKVAGMVDFESEGEPAVHAFGHKCKNLDEFKELVANKDWDNLFDTVTLYPGEFLHTPPGVIHGREGDGKTRMCCGTGGDVTYRFYDFDRNDPNRPLHLEQVYDTLHFPELPLGPVRAEPVDKGGYLQYDYHDEPGEYIFKRFDVNGKGSYEMKEFFFVTCTHGSGKVGGFELKPGQTLFIPADFGPVEFEGDMRLYLISCPDTK